MSDGAFFFIFFCVLAIFALTAGRSDGIFTPYLRPNSTAAVIANDARADRPSDLELQPIPTEDAPINSVTPGDSQYSSSRENDCTQLYEVDPHFTNSEAWRICLGRERGPWAQEQELLRLVSEF